MAFETGNGSNRGNGNGGNAGDNENWKAQGFINISIPSKDGGKAKLGSIPIYDKKPREKELREWLEKDPANVTKLLSVLIVDYQSAEISESRGFALPD